jgi:hypothetical protein
VQTRASYPNEPGELQADEQEVGGERAHVVEVDLDQSVRVDKHSAVFLSKRDNELRRTRRLLRRNYG